MSAQTWQETLATNNGVVGPTVTALTITSLLPTASVFTLPANYLSVGKRFKLRAKGVMNTTVTSPGTLTFTVNFGGVAVFASQAMALNAVAKSAVVWDYELLMECISIGSGTSATMKSIGMFTSEAAVGAASGTALSISTPANSPVAGTGFSSVAAAAVDFLATQTVNNSIILHSYQFESLN